MSRSFLKRHPEQRGEKVYQGLVPKKTDPVCPYYKRDAKLVTGVEVYPHRPDLATKNFWMCHECDAYVGCHPESTRPMGTLADEDLRRARSGAHAIFDRLWKIHGFPRQAAYEWLAHQLNLTPKECHIGRFTLEQCIQAALLVEAKLTEIEARVGVKN